jgi:hypothetical protein
MPIELQLILAGAAGSIVHEVVSDGSLKMPFLRDGQFYLGFLGGIVIGSFVGFLVDNNAVTALLAGYVGVSSIKKLLPPVLIP